MIQLLNNKLKIERVPALAPYVTLQRGISRIRSMEAHSRLMKVPIIC